MDEDKIEELKQGSKEMKRKRKNWKEKEERDKVVTKPNKGERGSATAQVSTIGSLRAVAVPQTYD